MLTDSNLNYIYVVYYKFEERSYQLILIVS